MKEYKYDKYDYLYTYFKAPVRMITLADCITLCKRYGMRVYLDIKDDGYDHDHQTELLDAVISEAVAAGIDGSCVFVSTNQDSRLYVRKKLPHAIIGYKTYIDSVTVEADLAGVSELGGNIMLQAETHEGSAESVRAALTAERIAAYREKKLPIKDIDYYFTFYKPDACKSSLRYVFAFETNNGGQTWNVIEAQSNEAAKNGAATLTKVENDNLNEYRFECDLFNGDLIRIARPLCTFESTDRLVYSAQYTDTGIDFMAESRTYSEMCIVKDDEHCKSSDHLLRGDILVTRTKGHTVVVLNDGAKASEEVVSIVYKLGERILKNGMDGEDVKELQGMMISLDYDCGAWGADGEFGDATELAVERFQTAHGCAVDGEVGPETLAALEKAMEEAEAPVTDARYVQIVNGNCYVRSAPNTSGKKLGVVHRGDILDYQGVQSADGWHLVVYNGQNGWVSGKYSELAEAIVLEHGVMEG